MTLIKMIIFPVTSAKSRDWLIIKTLWSHIEHGLPHLLTSDVQENPINSPHLADCAVLHHSTV